MEVRGRTREIRLDQYGGKKIIRQTRWNLENERIEAGFTLGDPFDGYSCWNDFFYPHVGEDDGLRQQSSSDRDGDA